MRRIPLSRRSHVTGFQPHLTGIAQHESALERDFVTLVRFADGAAVITSQPLTLEYADQAGTPRRYTPDFLVQWSHGQTDLVEVKYHADLRKHGKGFKAAFMAARRWARSHGMKFSLATDRSIRTPRLANAQRLLPLRSQVPDPQIAQHAHDALSQQGPLTFAELAATLRDDRAKALGTLWRMIARAVLSVDLDVPITAHSPIRLAPRPS